MWPSACVSTQWVHYKIKEYLPIAKVHNPRAVNLICDATFYGKRKDKLGTLVFMDSITHEILIWKHIQTERVDDYKYLLVELLNLGYTILSVTIDGKRGVNSVFKDYPVQMCHFHQKRIIQRYITLHPKLEASQELKKIMTRLKYSDENRFTKALDIWYIKYKSFLDEITIHPDSQKSSYTHKKLVAAYRSIRNNLPYLFTYKNYKNINISNYKSAFSKDINTGEIQGLLVDEGLNPAGFVKILNNLNYESFLIDFFMDDPDSGYGIYALRYIDESDNSAVVIQITKENNVYKITEVTNYK